MLTPSTPPAPLFFFTRSHARQVPPVIDLADQRVRLPRLRGLLIYRAPQHDVTGLLTSAASVIAAAAISPSLATHPTHRPTRPAQRDPFPLDDAFWVAVPPFPPGY